jgi:hypothetical protein
VFAEGAFPSYNDLVGFLFFTCPQLGRKMKGLKAFQNFHFYFVYFLLGRSKRVDLP